MKCNSRSRFRFMCSALFLACVASSGFSGLYPSVLARAVATLPTFWVQRTPFVLAPTSSARTSMATNQHEIPPIPCRDDFAKIAEEYFNMTGNAAEIGVFAGEFAQKNVLHWSGQYYMIDAWQYRLHDAAKGPAGMDKNFREDSENQEHMARAREVVTAHAGDARDRVHTIQELSTVAASHFADGYFDWIYIDAMHDYENVRDDLAAWWSKLRSGGLLSGDDYGDHVDTPLMPTDRYASFFGDIPNQWRWGVQRAVLEFAKSERVAVHVTWMHDCYTFPAWYIIKSTNSGDVDS